MSILRKPGRVSSTWPRRVRVSENLAVVDRRAMATGVASATIRYCDRLGNERVAQWGDVAPDELATAMPVRVPPTFAGQRNYPGLFWSVRSQRHLVYESLLELSHLWLLDFASTTAAISTQPFQLKVVDSSHVPDLLVLDTTGGVEVLDVKPAAFRFHPRFRSQVEISERLCTMAGWRYRVATEPDPVLVRNVQFLAVGRRPIAEAIGIDDDDVVAVAAGYSLGHVLERLREEVVPEGAFALVAALMWRGRLTADLTRPLTMETILEGGS
ncbi:TnsA-like heteromeric transposase endonuclease subunit [Brachybacterium alimentarium]|nr:TnsA-like heteromeric transposase endonuclease subunit [Brachybacterium alimentarium]